eukprot:310498_1
MDICEILTYLMIVLFFVKRDSLSRYLPIWICTTWLLLSCLFFAFILYSKNNDAFWWKTQNEFGENVIVPILPKIMSNKYKIKSSFFEVKIESSGCELTISNFFDELFIYPSYLFAHFIHCGIIHWCMGCNIYVTFYIVSMYEALEIYIFPYFDGDNECWYDHLFFDIFGFNSIGILLSILCIKLFHLNVKDKYYFNYNLLQTINNIIKFDYYSTHSLINAKKTIILIVSVLLIYGWGWAYQFCLFYMGGITHADSIILFESCLMYLAHIHYLQYFYKNIKKNYLYQILIWITMLLKIINLILRAIC